MSLAGSDQLAGATDGQSWLVKARALIDPMVAGICVVDFTGIHLATVSWLREAVIALNRYVRSVRCDLMLVMAGLEPLVREELLVALEATGQVAVIGSVGGKASTDPELVGRLDPALMEAFKAVEGRAEFDASVVCEAVVGVAPSAANNRLAALEAKGVLRSERRGRNRVYRTVLENLRYGN